MKLTHINIIIHIIILVTNSINGQLKIDNLPYQDEYNDHESLGYKAVAQELEDGIKESIAERDVVVKVLNLR